MSAGEPDKLEPGRPAGPSPGPKGVEQPAPQKPADDPTPAGPGTGPDIDWKSGGYIEVDKADYGDIDIDRPRIGL